MLANISIIVRIEILNQNRLMILIQKSRMDLKMNSWFDIFQYICIKQMKIHRVW